MTLPISGRHINLHPDNLKVVGTDAIGLVLNPAGDLQIATGFGAELKSTLANQYTFALRPRTASAPSSATDITNKAYVDALVNGSTWKDAVAIASVSASTMTHSGLYTYDTYGIQSGDRVLDKDNPTATLRGIWIATAGAWTRAADYASGEARGATVEVLNGSQATASTGYVFIETASGNIGTVAQSWTSIPSGVSYTAGNGLNVSGNVLSVVASDQSIVVDGTGIKANRLTGGGIGVGGSGIFVDIHGLTSKSTADVTDEVMVYDTVLGVLRKEARSVFLAGVTSGSTALPAYTITGSDVTAKQATLTGVGGNVSASKYLVFLNGIKLDTSDAVLTPSTGVLAWSGLSLDGRIASGDVVTVWGHL